LADSSRRLPQRNPNVGKSGRLVSGRARPVAPSARQPAQPAPQYAEPVIPNEPLFAEQPPSPPQPARPSGRAAARPSARQPAQAAPPPAPVYQPEPEPELAPEPEPDAAAPTNVTRRIRPGEKLLGSTRSTRRIEEPEPAPDSRRTTKKSLRAAEPVSTGIPKKYIILGSAALILLLVLVAGYSPFMRYWHTKHLDEGPALSDRKAAAEALFERFGPGEIGTFRVRANSENADLREAATHGLELVAKNSGQHPAVIERFAEVLPAADAPGKLVYIAALGRITKALDDKRRATADDAAAKAMTKTINDTVQMLLPRARKDETSGEVRLAAVEALAALRAPGVCQELIKLAATEQGSLRDRARLAIPGTALPEATGDLLKAMASADKDLAQLAKQAFLAIRDQAPSNELVKLVSDPQADVRREIVDALGKRAGDGVAAEGIAKALRDELPDIRLIAVQAVPRTGLKGPMTQLAALVTDKDENVRVATAETLGQLRDPESKKVVLEAFKNDLQGKTMEAFVKALGKRSSGKDMDAIGIVIPLLDSNPQAEASIREALVLLTLNGQPGRDQQRRAWDAAGWKKWYARILLREKTKDEALTILQDADKQKQGSKKLYPQLLKQTQQGLDMLEKCQEMCTPDDSEDAPNFERLMRKYMINKELFFKHQELDLARERGR
jgi:HEAT repeat protein